MAMKITVQPYATTLLAEEKATLYNILKRCEEDLSRRNSYLTDLILELKQVTVVNAPVMVRHAMMDDDTKLKIVVNFNKKPALEKLSDAISKELNAIKQEL